MSILQYNKLIIYIVHFETFIFRKKELKTYQQISLLKSEIAFISRIIVILSSRKVFLCMFYNLFSSKKSILKTILFLFFL